MISPAISGGQITTLLCSWKYLIDLKRKVARYEVDLSELLKLQAGIFSGQIYYEVFFSSGKAILLCKLKYLRKEKC